MAEPCEHVLAERREAAAASRDIAPFPTVSLPGRPRRQSSVRRSTTSTPGGGRAEACPVCGCTCDCARPRAAQAGSTNSPRASPSDLRSPKPSASPLSPPTRHVSPPPLSLPPSPSDTEAPHSSYTTPHHRAHETPSLALAPRTSPVPEESGRSSADTTSTKADDSGGLSKAMRERRRDRIFRYLPKSESDFDAEAQTEEVPRTWHMWANESVKTSALVPALVMQALATGLLDATTYTDFMTFASNQTGNAILLTVAAVGTVSQSTTLLIRTAVSFGSFLAGAFVFGQVGYFVGVRRRTWLMVSTALQTLFLVVACILLSPHGPAVTHVGGPHDWVILSLFALMSGGQVAMARQSSCQELPTAPMTSTFVDFVADHYLFTGWNDPKAVSRNRRLYYVVAMIGGSFLGAVMHRYSSSWIVAVIAVGIKLVALAMVALAKPDGCYEG
ncbi:unnamed protein product [Cutaneotrichosporon oleaginosum]